MKNDIIERAQDNHELDAIIKLGYFSNLTALSFSVLYGMTTAKYCYYLNTTLNNGNL